MIPSPPPSLKRSSPTDFELTPPAKRQDQRKRHHALRYSQLPPNGTASTPQDDSIIQTLLSRSVSLALNAVGFDGADPVAAESFRAQAEECMPTIIRRFTNTMIMSDYSRHASFRLQRQTVDAIMSSTATDTAGLHIRPFTA